MIRDLESKINTLLWISFTEEPRELIRRNTHFLITMTMYDFASFMDDMYDEIRKKLEQE